MLSNAFMKFVVTFIYAGLLTMLFGLNNALAQTASPTAISALQCINPALITPVPRVLSTDSNAIMVSADSAKILLNQRAQFTGNVNIESPAGQIFADSATITDNGNGVVAVGQVGFINDQLEVTSESISLNSNTNSFIIDNARYQLANINGNGLSETISVSAQGGLSLDTVSFTTCPLSQQDWAIKASEINIGQSGTLGQAFNTRFYVAGVPVLYLPYFAFPVTSQRQSGLLFPEITSSSTNGIDISQPFYWNIAPNYDATITPRILTNRGIQLNTQFRYLTEQQQGTVTLEYLASDDEFMTNDPRYFFRLQHQGQLTDNLEWFIDFNDISDDNYIVDFGSDFYNRADTYVNRTVGWIYHSKNLSLRTTFQDFDVMGENTNNYRALPHISVDYSHAVNDHWFLDVHSELSYFDNQNPNLPTATRAHIAPTLRYSQISAATEVSADFTWLSTHYQQSNVLQSNLSESVNRNIGQARLYAAAFFERPQSLTNTKGILTLSPQIQYLYTSYAEQDDIGLYDSARLLNNVNGLFRGQAFSGLDRISDNNQLTIGITARILDAQSQQRGAMSIGQIFYFDNSKLLNNTINDQRSALAAEFDFRLSQRWFAHSQLQLSTNADKVERSSVALEYRKDAQSLIQLSHRFVRDLSQETINQLGLSAAWPINEQWQWVGRWYKDRTLSRTIEAYAGLQYESCCWSVRLIAQRHLANRYTNDNIQDISQFDSGVALQFSFKGLSSSRRNNNMLQEGMFGYRQPYLIN